MPPRASLAAARLVPRAYAPDRPHASPARVEMGVDAAREVLNDDEMERYLIGLGMAIERQRSTGHHAC